MGMTNREKLEALSNAEYMKTMKKLTDTPAFQYVNWEQWLASEEEQLPYICALGKFKEIDDDDSPWRECLVLDDRKMLKQDYYMVLADGKLYTCPVERVKLK